VDRLVAACVADDAALVALALAASALLAAALADSADSPAYVFATSAEPAAAVALADAASELDDAFDSAVSAELAETAAVFA
jgi:hypothetical protein